MPVVRVNAKKAQERLGGAANVALNVTTLGAHASLLTASATTNTARRLRRCSVSAASNRCSGATRADTIVKLRVIGRSQQLIRVDFENEPDHEVSRACVQRTRASLRGVDVVLFSDYGKGGLTHIPRDDPNSPATPASRC